MNSFETIYLLLNKYLKEEIDIAITKLNNKERELLYKRYGKDLKHVNHNINWSSKERVKFYRVILKIKTIIEEEKKGIRYSNGRKVTTIYQRLSKYSKEDIDYIISLLPKKDKDILYLKYGSNLENPDINNWNKENDTKLERIIDKIETLLKNKSLGKEVVVRQEGILTIYQIFKEYSKEEVNLVIKDLTDYDKYLLYIRYGNDLENIDTSNWDNSYRVDFYKALIPKMRNRLRINRIKNNQVIDINPKVNINPKLEEIILDIENNLLTEDNILLENFSQEEVLIYILVQKMDSSYNINDLVNYFKVDRKYILKIVKNILESTIPTKSLVKR